MFDAIVLAGGNARRLGGADKPAVRVGSASLLEHVVSAVDAAARVIVVGPHRQLGRDVLWTSEQPPGGGPVAALAAGVVEVRAEVVVVLAADLPAVAPAVPVLVAALPDCADCAVLVDVGRRRNYLAAAWHSRALRSALAGMPRVSGAAMHSLYDGTRVVPILDHDGWSRDCDTWADVAAARRGQGAR